MECISDDASALSCLHLANRGRRKQIREINKLYDVASAEMNCGTCDGSPYSAAAKNVACAASSSAAGGFAAASNGAVSAEAPSPVGEAQDIMPASYADDIRRLHRSADVEEVRYANRRGLSVSRPHVRQRLIAPTSLWCGRTILRPSFVRKRGTRRIIEGMNVRRSIVYMWWTFSTVLSVLIRSKCW